MHEIKDRLLAMETELRSDIATDVARLSTDLNEKGEDTTPSQHPADVASDLYAREELLTDEITLGRRLDDVEDALDRMAKDRYGLCVDCGRGIAAERLEAMPQAARCIECQRRAERLRNR